LLISGLYAPKSKTAEWILEDYQDNRYLKPPYGYALRDPEHNYFNRGGFSIQPNLLAGLIPHIERDEPEVYIWMFFNAFAACYREEVNGMIEHPMPELGYANSATFKTSDEANAIMWLRYLYLYWNDKLLHIGRAMPRYWLNNGNELEITKVATYYGKVDVNYKSDLDNGKITLHLNIQGRDEPPKILARFRHPQNLRIKSVKVNGKSWNKFEPVKCDVDITGLKGKINIEARFL